MSHLKGIGFENFRVFEKPVWFDFAPITILTGPNSSGKSSISKALNLFKHNSKLSTLDFDTPDHQLGTFDLIMNSKSKMDKVNFYFAVDIEDDFKNLTIKLEYIKDVKSSQTILHKFELYDSLNGNIFFKSERNKLTFVDYALFLDLYYYLIRLTTEGLYQNDNNSKLFNFIGSTSKKSYLRNYRKLQPTKNNPYNVEKISERPIEINPLNTYFRWFCLMNEKEVINHFDRKIRKAEKDLANFKERISSVDYCNEIYRKYLAETKNYRESLEDDGSSSIDEIDALQGVEYLEEDKLFKNSGEILNVDEFILFNIDAKTNRVKKFQIDLKRNVEIRTKLIHEFGELKLHGLINQIERDTLKFSFSNLLFSLNPRTLDLWDNIEMQLKTNWDLPKDLKFGDCIERRSYRFRSSLSDFIIDTLDYIIQTVEEKSQQFNFIEAVRNSSQRLYSYNSNSGSFNDLLKSFQEVNFEVFEPFIKRALKDFEIADDIEVKKLEDGIGSVVYLIKDNVKTNLADLGFGTIQLLPILLQICIVANNNHDNGALGYGTYIKLREIQFTPSTLIIEEPESNLHPKLQSALAEFFIRANKEFKIQFIIETHSEYLIRKLQYLTAKKEIAPNDTVIYYLNSPKVVKETGVEQVVKIEIKKDGSLTNDFGTGFFDEALKWQLELMHLHNQN
jgi:predicted ATPase